MYTYLKQIEPVGKKAFVLASKQHLKRHNTCMKISSGSKESRSVRRSNGCFFKTSSIIAISLATLLGLQGCATQQQRMEVPQALSEPALGAQARTDNINIHTQSSSDTHKLIKPLPTLTSIHGQKENQTTQTLSALDLPPGELTLNADALPLNSFIHLALGEVLQTPFEMDPAVASRKDAVTLNISKPMQAKRLLGMVEETLDLYKVALVRGDYGLRVLPKASLKDLPVELASNSTRVNYGQTAEVIPLKYVSMPELQSISGSIFQLGKYGSSSYNKRLNAIVVIGDASRVKRFKDFVGFLDRPSFHKSHLRMVRPIYWQADELAKQIMDVMAAQGIPVSDKADNANAVKILVMQSKNALFVASPQKDWMQQAEAIIRTLDEPDAAGPGVRTFIYFTRHRKAEELGVLISNSLSGVAQPSEGAKQGDKSSGSVQKITGLNVVVDGKRSALIFIGTPNMYQLIVPVLSNLDIPVRQVLIEITVADVSLDDADQLGVEWKLGNSKSGSSGYGATLGTLGGLGVGSAGLSYILRDSIGNVRAKLNALATRGKAKILSSPTLLAMDGEKAHMQVGTQISVVTQEVSNVESGGATDTNLLRSFKYIDTGVILDISPTITDYGSIRMELKQEVSEPGAITGDGQPPIFKRVVDTVMVAESGQTVLLGGLMTHNKSTSITQVPILGDLPLIGGLFRNQSVADRSTELIILITPHIIRNKSDANELTQAYQQRLGW
jgi:general secretion pathway protein D